MRNYLIDLITFGCAIATLLWVHIPQPQAEKPDQPAPFSQQLTFGIRYIWKQQSLSLRLLLIITTLFWFAHDLGDSIQDPMILARTGGDSQVFASIGVAAGIGRVTGAIILNGENYPTDARASVCCQCISFTISECHSKFNRGSPC